MSRFVGFVIGVLVTCSVIANDGEAEGIQWDSVGVWNPLVGELATASEVIVKDHWVVEYEYDAQDRLIMLESIHRITRVNDDRGIERNNQLIIPLGNNGILLEMKARAYGEDGEVINLDESDMVELEMNNMTGAGFKMLAFEGLKIGSNVEFVYTIQRRAEYFGGISLQKNAPVLSSMVQLISPRNLVFIAKSYNGLPEPELTHHDNKRFITIQAADIPPMEDERYASLDANKLRVEYKLSHNEYATNTEMFTWTDAGKRFYEIVYDIPSKAEKAIKKEVKKLGLDGVEEEERIRKIEIFLKNEMRVAGANSDPIQALEDRTTSANGLVKLFAAFFKAAEIEHELVLTSNRTVKRFDEHFMTWNYLSDYLFYFPNHDQFLAPEFPEYRYGLFPAEFSANDGLFIQPTFEDGMLKLSAEVRKIPSFKMEDQYDNMEMEATLLPDQKAVSIKVQRTFGGQNAMFIKPYYDLLPEKEGLTAVEELLKFVGEDAQVSARAITNHDKDESAIAFPLEISGEMEVHSIVEKAGPNFILKIGLLIGQQVEMYQEKKRQNEVEMDYPHLYNRKIKINIPQGYQLKGLDKLNMDIQYPDAANGTMGFRSSYEVQGDAVQIEIFEYYKNVRYHIDQFERFREVINAAADFNKVVLVVEKI